MTKFTFELKSGRDLQLTEYELTLLISSSRGDQAKVDEVKEALAPKEIPNEAR